MWVHIFVFKIGAILTPVDFVPESYTIKLQHVKILFVGLYKNPGLTTFT